MATSNRQQAEKLLKELFSHYGFDFREVRIRMQILIKFNNTGLWTYTTWWTDRHDHVQNWFHEHDPENFEPHEIPRDFTWADFCEKCRSSSREYHMFETVISDNRFTIEQIDRYGFKPLYPICRLSSKADPILEAPSPFDMIITNLENFFQRLNRSPVTATVRKWIKRIYVHENSAPEDIPDDFVNLMSGRKDDLIRAMVRLIDTCNIGPDVYLPIIDEEVFHRGGKNA